jgi:hypothetical protein
MSISSDKEEKKSVHSGQKSDFPGVDFEVAIRGNDQTFSIKRFSCYGTHQK